MCYVGHTSNFYQYIYFNNQSIDFYASPGTVTDIILNWDDFLLVDRYRDRRYEFKNIQYLGVNKTVNEMLASVNFTLPDYEKLDEFIKKKLPGDVPGSVGAD